MCVSVCVCVLTRIGNWKWLQPVTAPDISLLSGILEMMDLVRFNLMLFVRAPLVQTN